MEKFPVGRGGGGGRGWVEIFLFLELFFSIFHVRKTLLSYFISCYFQHYIFSLEILKSAPFTYWLNGRWLLQIVDIGNLNMKLNGRWFPQIVDMDSGNLYPIYIKKNVALASEPVGGRSRTTELTCYIYMLTCITLTILLNINQDQSQDRTRVRTGPESGQDQSQDRTRVRTGPESGQDQSQDRTRVRTGPESGHFHRSRKSTLFRFPTYCRPTTVLYRYQN